MLHQTNNGICGWFSYAGYLAQQGFHVLLFDRRCTFNSSCATGTKANRHAADVQTAVTELRRRGAHKVVVVGASLGGAVTIGACAVVKTDGCVALSPALFDVILGDNLTANNAIRRVGVPLLVADAPDDSDSPLADVQGLIHRARPGVVRLIRLPAGAGHGWDTVNDPADPTRRSAFSDQLLDFLRQRLR
jgi:dienelactone hydrolase